MSGIEAIAAKNAMSAAPQTAAGIAMAGVNTVEKFLFPIAGPALGLIATYFALKTVAGYPPQFIKNIVG